LNKNSQSANFSLFAFTWAIAGVFHQLSFEGWRWDDIKGLLLSAALLWVLAKPSSWKRFAIYLVVDWISVAWTFPIHANHVVFSWIVNGTLLASLVLVGWQSKGFAGNDIAERWISAFAPWVRIELCILYFFTVFHKLNVPYLDPDWSCSVKLYVEIDNRFPLFPVADWAKYMTIYGTLIFETGIPLLLLFRRTRSIAVIIGVLFHVMLALHPHAGLFSFSSTMMALYTVFLPRGTAEMLKPKIDLRKPWHWALGAIAFVFVVLFFRKYLPADLHLEEIATQQHLLIGFVAFLIYFPVGFIMFIRALRSSNHLDPALGTWKSHRLLAVFIILLVTNGFGPYFGLKTQTSFSMFSNLHTENGMTNHLIMPAGIQITDWQYDIVEIIDTNNPYLISIRDKGLLVVFNDLRRNHSPANPDLWITFRRKGHVETFDMHRPETYHVLPPLNLITRRYFYFRPVERDPNKVTCKH
jgi:hypothetical protein